MFQVSCFACLDVWKRAGKVVRFKNLRDILSRWDSLLHVPGSNIGSITLQPQNTGRNIRNISSRKQVNCNPFFCVLVRPHRTQATTSGATYGALAACCTPFFFTLRLYIAHFPYVCNSFARYEFAMLRSPFYSANLNYYTLGEAIKRCEYPPLPTTYSNQVALPSQLLFGCAAYLGSISA